MTRRRWVRLAVLASLALVVVASAPGQVGKSQGLLDANAAAEKELLGLPHMTPVLAKGIVEKRPFRSVVELHGFLLGHGLSAPQSMELFGKAFIHVNLNTATREEILLIPGAGKRMAREFTEYRPWKSFAQFDREIGKYVGAAETARLAQYCFIPINLNTAKDEDILSIPGVGQRLLREFKEYRPYRTMGQFRKEIGKYVSPKEVARLERYVTIE